MTSASSTRSVFNRLPPLPSDTRYRRFSEWMDRHRVAGRIERCYPLITSVVCGAVASRLELSAEELSQAVKGVLPTALSVVSILAGFQAVSLSIVIGASSSVVVRRLREWGALPRVADYLKAPILTVTLFSVVGIVTLGLHFVHMTLCGNSRMEIGFLAGCFAWATLDSIRLALLMVKLFRHYLAHVAD